jgi:6-phosphogluconolactonase/glucosamine-6-phosphate isomerase/deaminase
VNLLYFDTEELWVEGVASFWRDRLRANPRLKMCLPSGHTPNKIYAAMGRAVAEGKVSFAEAEIFALDDFGGLAAEDPGRCANMLRRYLLDFIDLREERFHPIDTTSPNLEQVCRDYEATIGTGFDLTLLGLGLNGHLGLNEPGSAPDSLTRRVEMHPTTISASSSYLTHAQLPTWGVAVGLKQLLASKEVWLLANGPAKAAIVHGALTSPIDASLPASFLCKHPRGYFFMDANAGALVKTWGHR